MLDPNTAGDGKIQDTFPLTKPTYWCGEWKQQTG
jgi:hypothetical protein